jgi:hypothetical protein
LIKGCETERLSLDYQDHGTPYLAGRESLCRTVELAVPFKTKQKRGEREAIQCVAFSYIAYRTAPNLAYLLSTAKFGSERESEYGRWGEGLVFCSFEYGFPGYFTRPFLDHGFPHCCPPISRRVKAKVAPYPVYVGEARSRSLAETAPRAIDPMGSMTTTRLPRQFETPGASLGQKKK